MLHKSFSLSPSRKESGYIPSYERTTLTDKLHEIAGFRTNFEFIRESTM